MIKPIKELMTKLNYEFQDSSLLELALTHRSLGKNNNERLEFLGDSVLGFVVADKLYELFPQAKEGEMTRLRASLVKGETLADLAKTLGLGDYLRLGSGELKSGGFRRESILEDALEAVIGAIYLDADLATARQFILDIYNKKLANLDLKHLQKDAKTILQEYLQGKALPLPEYELVEVRGEAHDQKFYVACHSQLLKKSSKGYASSRRRAEQQAASEALLALQVQNND